MTQQVRQATNDRESQAEAFLVGLAGGVGGLILGVSVSWTLDTVMNRYAEQLGFDEGFMVFSFPIWLLAGAVVFSTVLSVISGLYPAMRAARVDPVEALRSE